MENSQSIENTTDVIAEPIDEQDIPSLFVVHASVGSGHRSAAFSVAEALEILRDEGYVTPDGYEAPSDLNIEVLDILDFGRIMFDGDKTASMFTGATRPFYDLTWRYILTGRLLWGGGTIWSHVMFPRFTEYVREKKPLAIIATHITAANVAASARMLSGQAFPLICVPTDYEIEGLWPHKATDLFCVANEYMAETLRPRKVPERDILITGIPARNDYRTHYDKTETRIRLGLPVDRTVVLVLAGAHLPRPYVNFRDTLDKTLPYLPALEDMHFVFIAGKDEQYVEHLKRECKAIGAKNVTVQGYTLEMAAFMAASDLAICKSGGLTVTECLCARVPMILLGRSYGQEKANTRMLTSMGASMHVTTARELLETLHHIEKNPQSMQAMLINGDMIRRPQAALDIARAGYSLVDAAQNDALMPRKKHFMQFYWGKKPAHIR